MTGLVFVSAGLLPSRVRPQGTTPPSSSNPQSEATPARVGTDTGAAGRAPAGPVAEHIAAGDKSHEAMQVGAALAEYEQAIGLDSTNYEALYKAAREAVDLGEFEPDRETRKADYAKGLAYARRAVAVNPSGADGHFHVSRALGRAALSVGGKARIRYAKEVRSEALTALKADSDHAGALHVMGVWNAEVMRLSGFERFIARNLLGGGVLGTASWKEAVRYMERSVALDPQRIVHHLDLGKIYADVGETAKAREEFQKVAELPAADYNDLHYKKDAEQRSARLEKGQ